MHTVPELQASLLMTAPPLPRGFDLTHAQCYTRGGGHFLHLSLSCLAAVCSTETAMMAEKVNFSDIDLFSRGDTDSGSEDRSPSPEVPYQGASLRLGMGTR